MGRNRRPSKLDQIAGTEKKRKQRSGGKGTPDATETRLDIGPSVPFEVTASGSKALARSATGVPGQNGPQAKTVSAGRDEDRRQGELSNEESGSDRKTWRFQVEPVSRAAGLSAGTQVRGTRDRDLVLLTHPGGTLGHAPGRDSAAMLNALEGNPVASLEGRVRSVSSGGTHLEIELRLTPR